MEDRRSVSARGVVVGATIGLSSGMVLNYLALFGQRFLALPWPGPDLSQLPPALWFIPVLLTTTSLGALYYSKDS